jgi:putative hemolysin
LYFSNLFNSLFHLPLLQVPIGNLVPLIVVIIILIALSFILAGCEVAYFSLSHKDINLLKSKDNDGSSRRVIALLEQPKKLLGSILIANSFVNLSIIILSNIVLDSIIPFDVIKEKLPDFLAGLSIFEFIIKVVVVTFVIALICEVLPKIWALHHNVMFAKNTSFLVEFFNLLFGRIASIFAGYTQSIENKLGGNKSTENSSIEELGHAIDSENQGDANLQEKQIQKALLTFGQITVRQIMQTRMDVNGLDANASFNDVVKKIADLHYSRLPVYNKTLDEIIGILHTKDILPHLQNGDDFNWQALVRKAFFVHEQKLIEDLLQEFRNDRIHFAVVVDEFGGTSGIVTLEDILEEVVGDINDEFDVVENSNFKVDDYNYMLDGRTSIHDMCKFLNLHLNTFDAVKGESESVAGLVLEIAEKIPTFGEQFTVGDFDFQVVDKYKNRIERVQITIKKNQEN